MSVRIASNISSLQSQRRLAEATSALGSVSQKLSSGLRINSAADDAAGLQISEGLRSDSKVFGQAVRNVNDGLSLLSVAQGAVQELSGIVIRQAELSEQAINGTYSAKQRQAMNAEANALVREYNRIVQTTSFNGLSTLNGITNQLRMQLGYGVDGGIDVGVGNHFGFQAGAGSFTTGVSHDSPGNIVAPKVADLNGDNILDMVSGAFGIDAANVSFGNGDGSFLAAVSYYHGYTNNRGVSLGDVNNDGYSDILISTVLNTQVLLNNGNGTFLTPLTAVGSHSFFHELADFNGDGNIDYFTKASTGSGGTIALGNGDGSFRLGQFFSSQLGGIGGDSGDFNGDGRVDIVVSDAIGAVIVMMGNGDGTFLVGTTFAAGATPGELRVHDYNNDGRLDLALAESGSGTISIFNGNGNGTFLNRVSYTAGTDPDALSAQDINGDGIIDLVTTDGIAAISVLLGNSNGSFRAPTSFSADVGSQKFSLTLADLNRDGIYDLTHINSGGTASVMLGLADSSGRRNNQIESLDLTTKYGAKQALHRSKETLTRINNELGNLGAMQSRLVVANQNLLISRENYDAAHSQLVDADIAQESATLVSTRIKQQASSAVLAQANQQPELALRLLGTVGS